MSTVICSFLFICFFLQAGAFVADNSGKRTKMIWFGSSLFNLILLTVFAEGMRKLVLGRALSVSERAVINIPAVFLGLYIVAAGLAAGRVYYRKCRENKTEITPDTIREAADTLPMGLCFFDENGQIQLMNKRMDTLGHKLRGKVIINGEDFWNFLEEGSVVPGCKCLSRKKPMIFQLPDNTVWQFDREEIQAGKKKITQVTASERTTLYQLLKRQEEENRELESVNKRLEAYTQKVEELTRIRQRLDMKVHIHDMFGRTLLETRYYLADKKTEPSELLKKWEHIILLLKQQNEEIQEDAFVYLKKAAASAGIMLQITGEIPRNRNIQELFLETGAEAMTNAVRHGKATRLWIETGMEKGGLFFRCSNDGIIPHGEITARGGLSALRQKTELMGGTMKITNSTVFSLKIWLPYTEEGKVNDTCIDCGR